MLNTTYEAENAADFDLPLMTDDAMSSQEPLTISVEVIAYIVLIALSLVLRLADLDTVPLTNAEAGQAFDAWRAVQPNAPGDITTTTSPLLFALQSIAFGLLSGSELAARLFTVIGGVALMALSWLFRDLIGRSRAFAVALLLAVSPVLFTASRFSSPVVWTMLAAGVGLWAVWRFYVTRQNGYGITVITAAAVMIFLTEPGGLILFLVLVGAGLFAAATGRVQGDAEYRYEAEQQASDNSVIRDERPMRLFADLPWGTGALVALLVVVGVSTAFIIHPSGLSSVAELLAGTLRGFSQPAPNGVGAFALVTALFYEPFLWIFAVIGVVLVIRRADLRFESRFTIAWVLLGMIAAILFRGAGADHALWLIVPLAVLASQYVAALFAVDRRTTTWEIPTWGRTVVTLAAVAILAVFTLAFQDVARSLLNAPGGDIAAVNLDPANVVLMLIPILFAIITYFMVASVWDDRTALRGFGLGLLVFSGVASLASGWSIAVYGVEAPTELWHTEAISRDMFLLRDSLLEMGLREGGGFMEVSVMALVPPDGTVAWLLRDFENTEFITDVSEARAAPIVVLPLQGVPGDTSDPDLGGSYVGQDFVVRRDWSTDTLFASDLPALWTQRRTRIAETVVHRVVLWLRLDIYQGIDLDAPGEG